MVGVYGVRAEGGSGSGEHEEARIGAVARGERATDEAGRTGAGAGGSEAAGRRRADAGGAVHHRLAERAEQISLVAAYFAPGMRRMWRARGRLGWIPAGTSCSTVCGMGYGWRATGRRGVSR